MLFGVEELRELADDVRILRVPPERHSGHPEVFPDEELDRQPRLAAQEMQGRGSGKVREFVCMGKRRGNRTNLAFPFATIGRQNIAGRPWWYMGTRRSPNLNG
jgi:hypothetical protein